MSMLWVRMYSDGYIILVIDICKPGFMEKQMGDP